MNTHPPILDEVLLLTKVQYANFVDDELSKSTERGKVFHHIYVQDPSGFLQFIVFSRLREFACLTAVILAPLRMEWGLHAGSATSLPVAPVAPVANYRSMD